MNPDDLAELEEQRRFLLRSLRDLDRERGAGDLDEADYTALRDGYTARAAVVLRSIEDGRAALPSGPPRRLGRLLVGIAATVVVAVGLGVLVARGSGRRAGTETVSGGIGGSVATLLSEARARLGSDRPGALTRYDKVLAVDPANVEALTYKGWVLVQDSRADEGEALIDKAIGLQSDYADARFFKGFVLVNVRNDPAGSLAQFDVVMRARPDSDVGKGAAQLAEKAVGQLLDQARASLTSDPVIAIKTYRTVLAFDPQNPTANAYVGFLLAQAGRVDEGLVLLDKAIARAGAPPDAHYLKASVLLNAKGDAKGAMAEIDAYLASKPGPAATDQANALRVQAQALLAGGRPPSGSSSTAPSSTLAP